MNKFIKQALVAAGIVTAVALPMSGVASDGTITFTGAVTSSSCTISVNSGGRDVTVALPTVDMAALTDVGARTTAAGTFFNVAVTACTAVDDFGGGAPANVQIYFEAGPNVDQTTGGLINQVGAGYSNVEVMLYNASEATVVGTQITPGKNTVQAPSQGVGANVTHWFYAGYSTDANGAASAGAVNTSVTYSLIYS